MKAITVRQPHASLIAIGAKRFATLSWPAPKSLPPGSLLAIHAATKLPTYSHCSWSNEQAEAMWDALNSSYWGKFCDWQQVVNLVRMGTLPLGEVVCVCSFLGCYPAEVIGAEVTDHERLFGDWAPGRFAWELELIVNCGSREVPAKGKQGLWEWEPPAWLEQDLAARASGAVQ